MTTDPRIAPLAAALLAHDKADWDPEIGRYPHACDSVEYWLDDAAAILAALPDEWGWREGYAENMNRLLQANLDYSAEIDRQQAELARLRAIEEAARALDESGYLYEIAKLSMDGEECVVALRAALEADHA